MSQTQQTNGSIKSATTRSPDQEIREGGWDNHPIPPAEIELRKLELRLSHDLEMTKLIFGTSERVLTGTFDLIKAIDDTNTRIVEVLAEKAPKVLELAVAAQENITLAHFELIKAQDIVGERIARGPGEVPPQGGGAPPGREDCRGPGREGQVAAWASSEGTQSTGFLR